jgi:23S rRNA (guanosine2251-2'-O)-methyltransferase
MIVILYNLRSLYNVGAIFRTADAVGVEKIYLCGITPSPLDIFGRSRPQLVKVALGAEKTVAWERCRSAQRLIDELKNRGYLILALEQAQNSIPYYRVRLGRRRKLALILGSEIKGLPASILRRAHQVLEIPMAGKKESLNVAVAFGVAAFALRDGRLK